MLRYQIWIKLSNRVTRWGIDGRELRAPSIQFLLGTQMPSAGSYGKTNFAPSWRLGVGFWGQTMFSGGTGNPSWCLGAENFDWGHNPHSWWLGANHFCPQLKAGVWGQGLGVCLKIFLGPLSKLMHSLWLGLWQVVPISFYYSNWFKIVSKLMLLLCFIFIRNNYSMF